MIRNVVFDVGNVLVKLHYQPFVGLPGQVRRGHVGPAELAQVH